MIEPSLGLAISSKIATSAQTRPPMPALLHQSVKIGQTITSYSACLPWTSQVLLSAALPFAAVFLTPARARSWLRTAQVGEQQSLA